MSKFKGKYIVAAIDGTGSAEWRNADGTNSFTYLFYRDFANKGGAKRYWHGPGGIYNDATKHRNFGERFNLTGTLLGYGSARITDEVTDFIETRLLFMLGGELFRKWKWKQHKNSEQFWSTRKSVNEKVKIILVGHSRGASIAINVAKRIAPFEVYFMALYDAVDMNIAQTCGYISNVHHTYHAIRHGFKSRNNWGNCGDTTLQHIGRSRYNPETHLASSGNYEQEYFETSHGGIGGDPSQKIGIPLANDMSCLDVSVTVPSIPTLYFNSYNSRIELSSSYKKRVYLRKRMAKCINDSKAANAWMRKKAKERGLSFM